MEAITFRHYGHVDWRKDIDVGVNRSTKDLENWIKRDPIERLSNAMKKNEFMHEDQIISLKEKIKINIEESWNKQFGDRKNELVFIGQDMDEEQIRKDLDNCLSTDEELMDGTWRQGYEDEWPVHRAHPVG